MEIREDLLAARPWLSHYLPGVPAEIEPQTKTTLVDLWRRSRATFGNRIALESFGARLTYEQLGAAADQVTAWLLVKGFGKGDRAAIMAPNVMAYPAILLGILQAGGVVVNVNPLYTPRELELQILNSTPRILFVLENFAQTVGAVADRLQLEHIVLVAPGDLLGAKGHLINFISRHVRKAVPKTNLPVQALQCGAAARFDACRRRCRILNELCPARYDRNDLQGHPHPHIERVILRPHAVFCPGPTSPPLSALPRLHGPGGNRGRAPRPGHGCFSPAAGGRASGVQASSP